MNIMFYHKRGLDSGTFQFLRFGTCKNSCLSYTASQNSNLNILGKIHIKLNYLTKGLDETYLFERMARHSLQTPKSSLEIHLTIFHY